MAGSNSKEPRGLGVKVWTKLQLLLTMGGLRVDFKKRRGSLANKPRRSGMDRSDPLDHDLVVQIKQVRHSNHAR